MQAQESGEYGEHQLKPDAASKLPKEQTLLFKRLIIDNFGLHASLTVNFAEKPIILISGANGSGKTQVLEALLLVLGHWSRRMRSSGFGKFVGEHGKSATVRIDIENPRIGGMRLYNVPDPDLGPLLDLPTISVEAKLYKSGRVIYRLNGTTRIASRPVTRNDIQRIFAAVNLRANNPLLFTQEGSIDVFSSKSPKKQLEALLEATSLQEYFEDISDAKNAVENCMKDITSLKRRVTDEEQRLQFFEAALEQLRQKEKLEAQKHDLEIEYAWSLVAEKETLLSELSQRISGLKENLSKLEMKTNDLSVRENEYRLQQRSLTHHLETLNDKIESAQKVITETEMDLQVNSRALSEADQKIKKYETQLARVDEQLLKQESGEIQHEIRALEHAIRTLTTKRKTLEDEFKELSRQISSLEQQFSRIANESGVRRMLQFERRMQIGSKTFQEHLRSESLNNRVIGPLLSLIRIKKGEEDWEAAVKNQIGRNLYAFLALDADAFRAAKRLFDSKWPDRKPPLIVAKVQPETSTDEEQPNHPAVRNWIHNLVDGNPVALTFLRSVVRRAVAEDHSDPNILADAARAIRASILSKDCKSYYLPIGAFGRPPLPIYAHLGTPLHSLDADPVSIKAQIDQLNAKQFKTKEEEIQIRTQILTLQEQLTNLKTSDEKLTSQMTFLTEELNAAKANIKVLKNSVSEAATRRTLWQEQLETLKDQQKEAKQDRKTIQGKLDQIKPQLTLLKQKIAEKNTELKDYEIQVPHIQQDLDAKYQTAQLKGLRPPIVREPQEVRIDLSKVNGQLELIKESKFDIEKYENQKMLFERVSQEFKQMKQHLAGLQEDLFNRLEAWEQQLTKTLEQLTRLMKLLLQPTFHDIRLSITEIQDPKHAKLSIKVALREGEWRAYHELSGGQRVLVGEALILALHSLEKSPLHAIDEFTQRLDVTNKTVVLNMVRETVTFLSEQQGYTPQFLLIAPDTLGMQLDEKVHHLVFTLANMNEPTSRR